MSRARCSRCSRTGASRVGPQLFKDPDWWSTATSVPEDTGDWYRLRAHAIHNSSGNPWRCVLNQDPGSTVGQAGDWMAVATDNCNKDKPWGTQCQDFKKKTDPDRPLCRL